MKQSQAVTLYDASGARIVRVPEERQASSSWMLDSWRNPYTGQGTSRDKTAFTRFCGVEWLSDQELSNLFHGDDIAQRMVCARPDETYREGFICDVGDDGLNIELAEAAEELGILSKFNEGERWGRLFGACALLIGADDGKNAAKPLEPERARDLSYLYVIDKRYLWPFTYYTTPGHPKLGQPETYYVISPSSHVGVDKPSDMQVVVHETRLIMFGGAPTALREKEMNISYDRSVLQAAYDALRSFNVGFHALEVLLTDGFQAVFKMTGLRDALGSVDGDTRIAQGIAAVDKYRSVLRAMVVDAGSGAEGDPGESFERNNITLSGVPEVMDKLMLRLAASVRTPVTILMGQSPAGMNATGESDFRWWYDDIRSHQQLRVAPKLRRVFRILLNSKRFGKPIESSKIRIMFPSLWTQSPKEQAETRNLVLTGDKLLVDMQAAMPEKIALTRLQPGGTTKDIVLEKDERKQYENALSSELDLLEEEAGQPEEDPALITAKANAEAAKNKPPPVPPGQQPPMPKPASPPAAAE